MNKKMVSGILWGFFSLSLGIHSVSTFGQTAAIKGSSVVAKPGQTVEVPIYLHVNEGEAVAALQFDLRYDIDSLTLLSVKAGEELTRAKKQLVSRQVDHLPGGVFNGRTGDSQYLDMRKNRKKESPAVSDSLPDPARKPAGGRERVLISGLNNYAIANGRIAVTLWRVKDHPRGISWTIDFSDVAMAGPDAKTVIGKAEAGHIRLNR